MALSILLWPGGQGLLAFDAVYVQPMSFGRIIPTGTSETLEIDARTGYAQATVVSGGTVTFLNNGYSGMIRVMTNSTAGGENVTVNFPSSAGLYLYDGGTIVDSMRLYFMQERSMTSGVTVYGNLDLYYGGRLDLKVGQRAGTYTGSVNVNLVIN
ncbi:MAG: DUF4402 domain-containing protein [Desulfovibrionaceae bacterium]|nr:DUF4402 domain-containing protein [Desulfovibrionaceae bacterium]